MSDLIRKVLGAEPRVLDAEAGIVEYVASNETVDAHGDKILLAGWRFNRMGTNPVFLNSHRKGSVEDVYGMVLGARFEEALIEKVQFAIGLGNPRIDTAFRMTEAGFLKAVSVGFEAVLKVSKFLDQARKKRNRHFESTVAEFGVSKEEAAKMNTLFVEQEQIELSAVSIGANPDALLRSFEEGAIEEKALSDLGFAEDEAFEFLTKAAASYGNSDDEGVMDLLIEREMNRTMEGAEAKAEGGRVKDEGGGNEEREEFLKRLDDVTSEAQGEPAGGVDATEQADGREKLLKALGK